MFEFSEEVATALAERGWLRDGRLRRAEIATEIARWLENGHVATTVEEEEEVAATIDEIAVGILGTTDEAMHELVSPLTGPRGMVQTVGLSDGLVIASIRVSRMTQVGDVPARPRKFSARFLSSDPAVLRGTIIEQAQNRVSSAVVGIDTLLSLVGERVPALAEDRARVLSALAGTATQLALPSE